MPWWPADDNALTLHHALVRVVSDTQRHAGHADIARELIDGAVGMNEDNASLPTDDPGWWRTQHQRVEDAARAGRSQPRADPTDSSPVTDVAGVVGQVLLGSLLSQPSRSITVLRITVLLLPM